MVAVGHERDVAVAHLRAQVDRPVGIGGVGAVKAEAGPAGGRGGDLEVVDLLQLALVGAPAVVLVGRVGEPEKMKIGTIIEFSNILKGEVLDITERIVSSSRSYSVFRYGS